MSVDKFPFGALADGTEVTAFRISRGAMSAVLLDYGATLQSPVFVAALQSPVFVAVLW